MCDLWVELNTINWFRIVCNGGKWSSIRSPDDVEVWRQALQLVSVGHPDLSPQRMNLPLNKDRCETRWTVPASLLRDLGIKRPQSCPRRIGVSGCLHNRIRDDRIGSLCLASSMLFPMLTGSSGMCEQE